MRTFAALFVLSMPSITFGFSAGAHRIIADIAWRTMDYDSQFKAYTILQWHPRYKEDFLEKMPEHVRNGVGKLKARWLFQQAAVWPDMLRSLPEKERAKYHRGKSHYIYYPTYLDPAHASKIDLSKVNLTHGHGTKFTSDKNAWNLSQALYAHINGYSDESRTNGQRAINLCWLIHVVGDAHQPLHSTAMFTPHLFPKGDHGGNLINVAGGGNLNSTWDRLLPNAETIAEVDGAATKLLKELNLEFNEVTDTPLDWWLKQSLELAQEFAYDREVRAAIRAAEANGDEEVTVKLSKEYLQAAGTIARRRVVEAGWRLSRFTSTLPHEMRLVRAPKKNNIPGWDVKRQDDDE